MPFQRADGTVMTQEEIANVAQLEQVKATRLDGSSRQGTGAQSGRRLSDEDLRHTYETWQQHGPTAAAELLGISRPTVKDRERVGPVVADETESTELEVPVEPVDTLAEAAFLKGASESAHAPVIAIVHHGNPDARAAAFSEGYDKAIEDYTPPKAIDALIAWLTENASTWNDDEAERWLKAFTATIDLVYPTRAAA